MKTTKNTKSDKLGAMMALSVLYRLLADAHDVLSGVYTEDCLAKDQESLVCNYRSTGPSFITKVLPALGKALDKALSGNQFVPPEGVACHTDGLPIFMWDLWSYVLEGRESGFGVRLGGRHTILCVKTLRQVLFAAYKLRLPYPKDTQDETIRNFKETERDVCEDAKFVQEVLGDPAKGLPDCGTDSKGCNPFGPQQRTLARARALLHELFRGFDASDIKPKHGPGAVSTKEILAQKFAFKRVNPRAQLVFPFDEYYHVSLTHVADACGSWKHYLQETESSAKVILVDKDSRGPRIISAEPSELQWLQQGLRSAMVEWIESHPLTRGEVMFTDQSINQSAALKGSWPANWLGCDGELVSGGPLATLDLKEASDRVSCSLVELLFPEPLLSALLATRSLATVLPDKTELVLAKFAPMGSATCFPVMALTIWALLRASRSLHKSWRTRKEVARPLMIYGDDVIVPTACAEDAIETLESFGLKVNVDKSCYRGFFRESCGVDAFLGEDVTPVRLRTLWRNHKSAEVYASHIAYANAFWHKGYKRTARFIAWLLHRYYGMVPFVDQPGQALVPALEFDIGRYNQPDSRWNPDLQRFEFLVRVVEVPRVVYHLKGWLKLLRYFTEYESPAGRHPCVSRTEAGPNSRDLEHWCELDVHTKIDTASYTHRKRAKLRWRWRQII